MNEEEKVKKLIENLKKLKRNDTSAKTAFLNNPEIKQILIEKFKDGIAMDKILKSITDSGFSVSKSTLQAWKKNNVSKKKKSKK